MERKHKMRATHRLSAVCAVFLAAWLCCGSVFAAGRALIPVGRTVGIQLHTPGALVVGLTADTGKSPAGEAGVRAGDLITALDGRPIGSSAEFMEAAAMLCGDAVELTVQRGEQTLRFRVSPMQTAEGWRLGVWLRDSISGIGTVTFIDPETGFYGALGHPINDMDTGVLLPLGSGAVTDAEIVGIRRGQCGVPGELYGRFDFAGSCGSILSNTTCGIFGYLEGYCEGDALPVADESEIHTGEATILSNVQGQDVAAYAIEIEQVWRGDVRSLCFRVKDEALLNLTGGIVQGMSGSPILQDGKLIGAVTHVLVNDPTRGYGVSVAQMLSAGSALDAAA